MHVTHSKLGPDQAYSPSRPRLAILAILAILLAGSAFAADHGDGAYFADHPQEDIADFFIFPRDAATPRLTMILSVNPKATAETPFSDALIYRMRLRPITGFQAEPFKAVVADREMRVDCRATKEVLQQLTCVLLKSDGGAFEEIARASVNTRDPSGGDNPDFRIFGGPRADQLFTDRTRVRLPVWRDEAFDGPDWPGVNSDDGKNVLSIVVDLALEKYIEKHLGPETARLAAVSEILNTGGGGQQQIDRMDAPRSPSSSSAANRSPASGSANCGIGTIPSTSIPNTSRSIAKP